MRRAASKCRPADVSLNGYRTPDPDLGTKSASRRITVGVRPGGYDRAARPSLDPRRCPRGWRHTESRRARERPAARRARAARRPTRARPSDSEGAFRAAGDVRRRSPRAERPTRPRRPPATIPPRSSATSRPSRSRCRPPRCGASPTCPRNSPSNSSARPPRRPRDFPRALPTTSRWRSARIPLAFIVDTQRRRGDVVGLFLAGSAPSARRRPEGGRGRRDRSRGLFVKEGTAFFPGSSLAGEGLLVSDGESWARQRRLSNPAHTERRRGGRLRDGHGARRGGAAASPSGSTHRLPLRIAVRRRDDARLAAVAEDSSARTLEARAPGDQRRHQGGVRVLRQTIRRGHDRPGVGSDTR